MSSTALRWTAAGFGPTGGAQSTRAELAPFSSRIWTRDARARCFFDEGALTMASETCGGWPGWVDECVCVMLPTSGARARGRLEHGTNAHVGHMLWLVDRGRAALRTTLRVRPISSLPDNTRRFGEEYRQQHRRRRPFEQNSRCPVPLRPPLLLRLPLPRRAPALLRPPRSRLHSRRFRWSKLLL